MVDYYSDDNDSDYKEYHPRHINKPGTAPVKKAPAPQQNNVVYVPVPMPAYSEDNDNAYRNVGEYNPNPVHYTPGVEAPVYNSDPGTTPEIPVPTPSDTEDFDNQNELYYY